jgi:hypothetical protein
LAERSLDPELASQHIGLLCWEISRSTIAGALGFLTFTQCGQRCSVDLLSMNERAHAVTHYARN